MDTQKMTKRQVIKQLEELGCTNIIADGKYSIRVNLPKWFCDTDRVACCDPRDLLEDMLRAKSQMTEEPVTEEPVTEEPVTSVLVEVAPVEIVPAVTENNLQISNILRLLSYARSRILRGHMATAHLRTVNRMITDLIMDTDGFNYSGPDILCNLRLASGHIFDALVSYQTSINSYAYNVWIEEVYRGISDTIYYLVNYRYRLTA